MFPSLNDIRIIRKNLDLTQHDLAKKAGISQSLIAKIESGKIDPTYSKAKNIFETLNSLTNVKKTKAKEIMNKKVVTAKPKEMIKQVIVNMRKHSISQLPVFDNHQLVGIVSESIILNALLDGKNKYVCEIMDQRPPSVSMDTDIDVISTLLRSFQLVAVFDKHKMIGIITKSDLIDNLN
jgi:predicted transcriptional regulator